MNRFTDSVLIDGRVWDVIILAPEGQSVLNVQELAEKAARSVNREITLNRVTVKVKPI